MSPDYPVYIVSKGRAERCLTADCFIGDDLDFYLVVEPQEYNDYKKQYPDVNILKTPFSNLGKGSTPARNFVWEHAQENNHKRHWVFDDNIRHLLRLHKGKRVKCNANIALSIIEDFTDRYENIAISGFNYRYFVTATTKKPIQINCHVYSALLIDNSIPYKWRLKYNEDVDLCLQVLSNGLCTVLFNAFLIEKTSTTVGMPGGNQDELYDGNNPKKHYVKARTLQKVWPDIVDVKKRFGRPHHIIKHNWKQFNTPLKRRDDIDWSKVEQKSYDISLVKKQ